MAPFKIPLDAWVLMVPITYASVMMATMTTRAVTTDPDASTLSAYDDETTHARKAQSHDTMFKSFFAERIRNRNLNVFSNRMSADSPQ